MTATTYTITVQPRQTKPSVTQLIADLALCYVEADEVGAGIAALERAMVRRMPQLDADGVPFTKLQRRRVAFLSDCTDYEARLTQLHHIGQRADKLVDRLKGDGWVAAITHLGRRGLDGSIECKRRYRAQSEHCGNYRIELACESCRLGDDNV